MERQKVVSGYKTNQFWNRAEKLWKFLTLMDIKIENKQDWSYMKIRIPRYKARQAGKSCKSCIKYNHVIQIAAYKWTYHTKRLITTPNWIPWTLILCNNTQCLTSFTSRNKRQIKIYQKLVIDRHHNLQFEYEKSYDFSYYRMR